ncbi:hypothetical protein D3C87_1953330 [compost metagenome]
MAFAEKIADRFRKGSSVTLCRQQAGPAVFDDFGNTGNCLGDNRKARSLGFEIGKPIRLSMSRPDEH